MSNENRAKQQGVAIINLSGDLGFINITKTGIIRIKRQKQSNLKREKK